MSRSYPRLGIAEFGAHLLSTGDLDPVYIALHKMELPEPQLHRWLVAYWCLYHCGAASYLSELEGTAFWHGLRDAARNDQPAPTGGRWPRGHERRHFRGEAASKAVRTMAGKYLSDPERIVEEITQLPKSQDEVFLRGVGVPRPLPFELVSNRAQELPLFGPWIGFKVADMVDRVLGIPVDFSEAAIFMFKDPVEAALMLWRMNAGLSPETRPKSPAVQAQIISAVVEHLRGVFSNVLAPPLYDRPVGLQEIETILCKNKSHVRGHYPLFNDIDEITQGLSEWVECNSTARLMLGCMPRHQK